MKRILNTNSKKRKYAFDMIHKIPTKNIHYSLNHRPRIIIPSQSALHNKLSLYRLFKTSQYFQHIAIKQKVISPMPNTKKRKVSIDSLKTIKGEHYNDTECHICNVCFPSTYQAEEHVASNKHLKKMLEHHSNCFQTECIYCNVAFTVTTSKTNHLSSTEHHSVIKLILKQLKPSGSIMPTTPNSNKSVVATQHLSTKHICVKGVKNIHYTDTHCAVCDISFDSNNSHNLTQHLNGSKHIKNILAVYSGNYENKCIYCNALCNTPQLKHSHMSSNNHTDFINSMIAETQTRSDNEWIISLEECKKRIGNVSNVKKKKQIPTQTMSATRIRKAIRDCYDDRSVESIDKKLSLLQKLYHRSAGILTEKDHISILFCVSSLMRTNDISVISKGLVTICQLFSDDMDTLAASKWKMNHKLFEQLIDIIILSVNIKQLMHDFDMLITDNMSSKDAFNHLLGIDAERTFLQPFSCMFEFFNDISKWNDDSFENVCAHKYFMKWSQLIFEDMIYKLRDIRYCQQTDFDLNYKLLIKKSYVDNNELPVNINNALEVRKYCCFTENKRMDDNSGPFTNITMFTPLECSLSSLSKGSFVILFPETNVIDNKQCIVGYIYKMSQLSQTITLRIADHGENIENDCKWHLLSMGASGVSFESQWEALQKITNGSGSTLVSQQLRSILYNNDIATEAVANKPKALIETALLCQLNESQRRAVDRALNDNNNMTLIQGPPGTGKTHVAAAIVEQYFMIRSEQAPKAKILLSAYSNIAVDVLTERVQSVEGLYPLRIGHDSTIDAAANNGVLLTSYAVWEWQDKIRQTEIICSTSIGTASELLKNIEFDLILIDETSQSTECGLLVALSKLKKENGKIVLIGDHKQLPPTVLSSNAKKSGLDISLFERLICEKSIVANLLDTQYRMHPKLAEFPSLYFYDNKLLTGIDAKAREIPDGFEWPVRDFPIAFVQTGDDAKECVAYTSTINEREAEIVTDIVFRLLVHNNNDNINITVISPYSAQKKLIDESLYEMLSYEEKKRVKVRTVDGFQGSECDIIVFSATRCNHDSIVGFLKDYRRINVMLTRPKNGLIVVGHRNTLSKGDPLWNSWLKYVCDDNKAIVTRYS